MSPPSRLAAPLVPSTPPLPPGLPQGLHGWDLARLCPPPDPPTPLPRTNQSAGLSIANALHHLGANSEGSETDPNPGQSLDPNPGQPRDLNPGQPRDSSPGQPRDFNPGQPRDSSVNQPRPASLARVMRSMSGGDVAPQGPCQLDVGSWLLLMAMMMIPWTQC